MKNLDNIFTKKICTTIFIISLLLFSLFEFLIFDIWFILLFFLVPYVICILFYLSSSIIFINIGNKNIGECILFIISSLCLIFAGLTDACIGFLCDGPLNKIIDFVPEITSDLNFKLCTLSSVFLIIIIIIKIRNNIIKMKSNK